jgi:RNA polymerase II subunit A small phosphatase-like protein
MSKKTLILDLDETLIHTESVPDDYADMYDYDFIMPSKRGSQYYTKKRPYLDQFLTYAFENFDVAVWTAAGEDYAKLVLSNIGVNLSDLKFLYTKDNCTLKIDYYGQHSGSYYGVKNLNKLKKKGYDLDQVLIVDDIAATASNNYGNLVLIKPFVNDYDDTELLKLISYLETIKDSSNVRRIEKRGWSNL